MVLYYAHIPLGLEFPFISAVLGENFDFLFIPEKDILLVDRGLGEEPAKVMPYTVHIL